LYGGDVVFDGIRYEDRARRKQIARK